MEAGVCEEKGICCEGEEVFIHGGVALSSLSTAHLGGAEVKLPTTAPIGESYRDRPFPTLLRMGRLAAFIFGILPYDSCSVTVARVTLCGITVRRPNALHWVAPAWSGLFEPNIITFVLEDNASWQCFRSGRNARMESHHDPASTIS